MANRVVGRVVCCKLRFVDVTCGLVDFVRDGHHIDIAIERIRPVSQNFRLVTNPTNNAEPSVNVLCVSRFAVAIDDNARINGLALANKSRHVYLFDQDFRFGIQSDWNDIDSDACVAKSLGCRFGRTNGLVAIGQDNNAFGRVLEEAGLRKLECTFQIGCIRFAKKRLWPVDIGKVFVKRRNFDRCFSSKHNQPSPVLTLRMTMCFDALNRVLEHELAFCNGNGIALVQKINNSQFFT